MGFTIYRSTDASAPVLTGQTGSLVTLLDAVLVNGYGAKAAAGWTKSFSGTSKAVYRMAGGSRNYLRVQDDGPGAGTFKEARIQGFETGLDIDSGIAPFPNSSQSAIGTGSLSLRKSTTADATARAWIIFADDRSLHTFIATGDTAGLYLATCFADIYSGFENDFSKTLISGGNTENSATTHVYGTLCAISSQVNGKYMSRGIGISNSLNVGMHGDNAKGVNNLMDGQLRYPCPLTGSFWISPLYITDPTSSPTGLYVIRGMVRGIYQGLYAKADVVDGQTYEYMVAGEAKTFIVVSLISCAGSTGYCLVETSDTLPT